VRSVGLRPRDYGIFSSERSANENLDRLGQSRKGAVLGGMSNKLGAKVEDGLGGRFQAMARGGCNDLYGRCAARTERIVTDEHDSDPTGLRRIGAIESRPTMELSTPTTRPGLRDLALLTRPPAPRSNGYLLGILEGEGVGPEVVPAALRSLEALQRAGGGPFVLERGGPIRTPAEAASGASISPDVVQFCERILNAGGAVLCGPGGGRFVYDLRRRLDLFCKLSPIRAFPELKAVQRLHDKWVQGTDLVLVRENVGGIYQGEWSEGEGSDGAWAEHRFRYSESDVRRIVRAAGRLAAARRGRLLVTLKEWGIPTIARLWRRVAMEECAALGVTCEVNDIDFAIYRLIQESRALDVVVSSNLFGDIVADAAGVIAGGRPLTFSGNFRPDGGGVYQTNHGAAFDLAGTGRANPAGQILSLAMLLRESFGLADQATILERALARAWQDGWRTPDVMEPGAQEVDTATMGDKVAQMVTHLASDWTSSR
jgi:3-isopropylmalate dehydrogenase